MTAASEFTAADAQRYDHRGPLRWVVSHVGRRWWLILLSAAGFALSWIVYSQARVLIGQAVARVLAPEAPDLLGLTIPILVLLLLDGVGLLIGAICAETVAAHFEADARRELYASLLERSQAFHDRQRTGDLMARATDDTAQLSNMIVPGSTLLLETVMGIATPIIFIGTLHPQLLVVPLLFVASYIIAVRQYMGRLSPIIQRQREQFGAMNAGLEETISGIEVVKAAGREAYERVKFRNSARKFRDLFVQQGLIEARYLPLLLYGIALGAALLHTIWLYRNGTIGIAEVIGMMGLMSVLRFPTFISIFALSTVQSGIAGARRILQIITETSDLDQNRSGRSAPIAGEIVFDQVDFGYQSAQSGETPVLRGLSFRIPAGSTAAIVGQTGSGKSALSQLVNRTYDASGGRVLIDGVDVRDWNLDSLRAQVAKIEQDIFLFSRSIAENIAFGASDVSRAQIEDAARAAQAHTFISALPAGYDTVVGERGMTLSGGQRQRVALARAFLSDPRILILDDATSAIDSKTEDEIQRAITVAQRGRTTLLITHRIAQIRWADVILVLDAGRLVASGSHDDLLRHSPHYRRIFARYDTTLPPLEPVLAGERS